MEKQILTALRIAIVAGITGAIVFVPGKIQKETLSQSAKVLGQSIERTQEEPADIIPAAPEFLNIEGIPQLTAKSAFAYDLASDTILYSSNFQEKLQIASLTKIMTALVVVDHMDMNKVVTVTAADIHVIGSNMGLVENEQIKVIDLLNGLLIPSSNDAAKTLARATAGSEERFVDLMNAKAAALGMESTHYENPVGLDDEENYSTAYDLSKLVSEFVKNPILSQIVQNKNLDVTSANKKIRHHLRTTNQLMLEDKSVTGIKTGFTSLAKGNLIIRKEIQGAQIISIVLGSDNREEDTRRLLQWIGAVYKW